MQREGDEVHIETDEVRGGESTGVMRWVLGVSLFMAIILLSGIWMFGAWTQDDAESEINVSDQAMPEADVSDTDSIVIENADEIDAADTEAPGTIEN